MVELKVENADTEKRACGAERKTDSERKNIGGRRGSRRREVRSRRGGGEGEEEGGCEQGQPEARRGEVSMPRREERGEDWREADE